MSRAIKIAVGPFLALVFAIAPVALDNGSSSHASVDPDVSGRSVRFA